MTPTKSDSPMTLGAESPNFELLDTRTNTVLNRDDTRGEAGLLVAFICNHCPYVVHIHKQLTKFGKDYQDAKGKGIGIVAISSNDVQNYPADAPDLMRELANDLSFTFPYLYDESQEVAQSFAAVCTPEFFLFDKDMRLVYLGRMDATRPGSNEAATGDDLRAAVEAVLNGTSLPSTQYPAVGCSIKWKS